MTERRRGPAATADDAYATWLGLRPTDVGEMRLTVRPELVNPLGKLYGPIGFALVDYAMGDIVWNSLADDQASATVNIAINYLTSTHAGEVVCRATLDRRGKALAFTSAAVHDDTGKLLMTAVGTFAVIPLPGAA